jgi:hypothetical protein
MLFVHSRRLVHLSTVRSIQRAYLDEQMKNEPFVFVIVVDEYVS